jgi:hypothetical protein
MRKIKITEKQVEILGLKKINENDESGIKSVNTALGDVVVRMVISGESVPKFKDRITQLIARHDKDARVGFFEATGKIVSNVKEIKLDSIKRDIKTLDPTMVVEKKPLVKSLKEGVKNIVKISKQQYNRIFASKLIYENDVVKGGGTRIDKSFKKEFTGKDVQNLKPTAPVTEDKFKIEKPNPSLNKSVQGKFGSTLTEGDDQFKNEVKELIKFLYRKSEELSSFWEKHGVKYDDICDSLLGKKLIVSKNGKYEVSKKLGSPQAAIQAIEDQLTTLLPSQQGVEAEAYPSQDAPQTDAPLTDSPQTDAPTTDAPSLETESNYPAGADKDSTAPYNEKKPSMSKPTVAKESKLEPVAFNNEVIILKDPQGSLYAFYYDAVDKKNFMEYASVERHYTGKDEDGQPEYDYDFDNANIDANVVANYVNDNLATMSKGEGAEAYEKGAELVKIDDSLKQELLSLYSMDKNIAKVLAPIEEISEPQAVDTFKKNVSQAFTPTQKPKPTQSKIVAKLAELKAKEAARRESEKTGDIEEMTSAASSGAFTAPMSAPIKREMPETPVVGEASTVASAGNFQYDTPGGLTMDLKSHGKTKAEKTPQWAGGSFVKQPECSKLNNNKSAENGGCNQGASSLKTIKTKGSVNAPSLGESDIYEAIAKKTGKSIDEVKRIINSKNKKA